MFRCAACLVVDVFGWLCKKSEKLTYASARAIGVKYSAHDAYDVHEVKELFVKTFSDSEGESEGLLIGALVEELLTTTDRRDLRVFAAREGDFLAGCILFTRLTFEGDMDAFLLAPVAVLTRYQGKGVGQQLIRFGLESLREEGVPQAFTYGDPAFYSKVGFRPVTEDMLRAPLPLTQPEGWLCQSLNGHDIPRIPGKSSCVKAFDNPAYW